MNRKLKFLIMFLIISIISFIRPGTAKAETTLDEIQDYNITVDVRQDGSLDMNYEVSWKVLDSNSEGPLEWVKIGVPNKHVDEIKGLTDNIKKISYYEYGGQEYIRIDLDKKYYAGDIVKFNYSFHQEYMYVIDQDTNDATYSFTPGWFDDIEVKNLTIKWNSDKIKDSSSDNKDGNYYYWNTALAKEGKFSITVKYPSNAYSFNPDKQQSDSSDSNLIFIAVIIVVIFIGIAIAAAADDDNYSGGFGTSGGSRSHIHTTRSSGCVRSSCACACACACAGGGRAGCSLKDFYGTNLNTTLIKKAIIKRKGKRL